ncbi:uncharacterized protein LOC125209995 [Salvia hispanica]|uniref:uncharacterized protein LOC125209995 n=1 Tax=Salvia hispanica TaxID=49212 RepID=UPI0020095AE6|nr:uncharacterized protein LOC125209995 [Salvia hispanica]
MRCAQQTFGCSFLAHKVCADLLPILKFGFTTRVRDVMAQPCPDPAKCSVGIPLMVDLSWMATPSIVKHSSHSQHLLFRTSRRSMISPISCCSSDSLAFDVYKCSICDFYIHIRCAALPKMIHFHKFDQHPLHLITAGTSNSFGSDHDICEVCEEDIECKYWFFHSAKCDYSFHVNCIPSVGYLSKVKFGGKYSMSCHSHPLMRKRMLTYGRNERCGYCHKIIVGLVDQVAFSCEQCDYWIHFSCASDSLSSSHTRGTILFEEFDL